MEVRMMAIARVYGLTWALAAVMTAILFVTDSLSFAATMLLGFTASVVAGRDYWWFIRP